MLLAGAFAGLKPSAIAQLIHVRLGGREPPGESKPAEVDANVLAARAMAQLKNRIAEFDIDRPYLSRVMTFSVQDIGDYDTLARVREWAIVEDDPLAGQT